MTHIKKPQIVELNEAFSYAFTQGKNKPDTFILPTFLGEFKFFLKSVTKRNKQKSLWPWLWLNVREATYSFQHTRDNTAHCPLNRLEPCGEGTRLHYWYITMMESAVLLLLFKSRV